MALSLRSGILCKWTSFVGVETRRGDPGDGDNEPPCVPMRVYSARDRGGQGGIRLTGAYKGGGGGGSCCGGPPPPRQKQVLLGVTTGTKGESVRVRDNPALLSLPQPRVVMAAGSKGAPWVKNRGMGLVADEDDVDGDGDDNTLVQGRGRGVVMRVLALQSADGHWTLTPPLLRILLGKHRSSSGEGGGKDVGDESLASPAGMEDSVWATLVVLVFLATKAAPHRVLWDIAAGKARRFVSRVAGWGMEWA